MIQSAEKWMIALIHIIIISISSLKAQLPWSKAVSSFHPPIMNIDESYIDITANSTLKLECEGKYPLQWKVPTVWENRILERVIIKNDYILKSSNPYFTQLTIPVTEFTDTGLYSCYYNGTVDMDRPDNVSSVYVFVNDPDEFFVIHSEFGRHFLTTVKQGQLSIIECLPTYSKMKMTLWKIESVQEEEVELGKSVTFDPMKGFILHFPYNYFEGLFTCRGEINNDTQEIHSTLFFLADTSYVPTPTIEKINADYVTLNGTFELKCTVTTNPGVKVYIDWIYPNQNNQHITVLDHTSQEITSSRSFTYASVSRVIKVENAQMDDKGVYTCNVTDHSSKTAQTSVHITIYDYMPDDFLNLTTDIDTTKPFEANAGSDVKIIIWVSSRSKSNEVLHAWKKDSDLLEVKGRYSETQEKKKYQLSISKVQIEDSGDYTLIAELPTVTANLTITLAVRDKPKVIISHYQEFFELDQQNYMDCVVNAHPFPDIWWRWKPCPELINCDTTSHKGWVDIAPGSALYNNETTDYQISSKSYKTIVRLKFIAHQSGIYQCHAVNVVGGNQTIAIFRVSDAVNGLDIKEDVTDLVVEDFVRLTCRAHVYNFTSMQWYRKSQLRNHTLVPITNESSYDLEYLSSKFSHSLVLTLGNVTLNETGEYVCLASWNEIKRNVSVQLKVKGIVKPYIEKTNMNGSTVTVHQTQEVTFWCYVKGVPQPVIAWLKDGSQYDTINMSGIEVKDNNQTLIIKRVMASDGGRYECVAENKGGRATANQTLSVISDQLLTSEAEEELTDAQITVIAVLVITAILLIGLAVVLGKKMYHDKKQKRDLEFINHALFDRGQLEMLNPDIPLEEQAELLPYDHHWEFPKDRLKLGKTLGQGAFGRVVKAEAIGLEDGETSTTVAVKMLKERANAEHQKALMAELKILIHLGRHLNIVNLLGAVTKNVVRGELMVIVEYCRFGNLRHYLLCQRDKFINQLNPITGKIDPNICALPLSPGLRKESISHQRSIPSPGINNPVYRNEADRCAELLYYCRSQSSGEPRRRSESTDQTECTDMTTAYSTSSSFRNRQGSICYRGETKDSPVSTCDLICYAFQCARGMEYLAAKKLIHRDLAARNVLLAEDNIVKICDFGLAKDCYKYSNYVKKGNGPLPIKWMAIESIRDKVFTIKSDVWSFGVLLWEMFTLGGNPYPGIEINEEFYKKLKDGYRMERPDLAPDAIYDLMQQCWQADPKSRPDFTQLEEKIGDLLEEGVRKYYIDLNGPYSMMNEMSNNNEYLQMDGKGDYMNMRSEREHSPGAISDEGQADVLLHRDNPQVHYKNIGAIRPVGDGPVPIAPMEVVPMIQLEGGDKWIDDNMKTEKKIRGPPPALPPIASDQNSDYLLMQSPSADDKKEKKLSMQSDNSSDVFIEETSPPPSYNLVLNSSRFPPIQV